MMQKPLAGFLLAATISWCSAAHANDDQTIAKCIYNASPPTVVDGEAISLQCDVHGALETGGGNPANSVFGVTAAISDTTSTSIIASAGGALRNYVTDCMVTNSHATVGTFVKILDGSTIIDEGYAASAGGGFSRTYPTPRRGTAATAVNCQPVTTGANVICSCGGYKGT